MVTKQAVGRKPGSEVAKVVSPPLVFVTISPPNSLLLQFVPWLVWITLSPRARFVIIVSPRYLLLPFLPSLVFAAV